jgi:hypothetical protein
MLLGPPSMVAAHVTADSPRPCSYVEGDQLGCLRDIPEPLALLGRGWVVATARERRRLSPEIGIIPWTEVVAGQIEFF